VLAGLYGDRAGGSKGSASVPTVVASDDTRGRARQALGPGEVEEVPAGKLERCKWDLYIPWCC
jgi:hypothetical protein